MREDIREIADKSLEVARALADKPTLQRLWREQRVRSLGTYLKRTCHADRISGCALAAPGSALIIAGKALPWDDTLNASAEQGDRLLVATECRAERSGQTCWSMQNAQFGPQRSRETRASVRRR